MVDPAAVVATLGLPPPTRSERLASYDATVWRTELADGRCIAVRWLRAEADADAEVANLRLARSRTPLAPQLVATGTFHGRAVLALSWCPGRAVAELVSAGDPYSLGAAFGRAQRTLHRRVDGAVLCHLDYHPANVLADDEGRAVTGIVDWTNARLDDPCADLAWTTLTLDLTPALVPALAAAVPDFAAGWRDGYRVFPSEATLRPYLASAARRMCAEWSGRDAPPAVHALVRQLRERHAG